MSTSQTPHIGRTYYVSGPTPSKRGNAKVLGTNGPWVITTLGTTHVSNILKAR